MEQNPRLGGQLGDFRSLGKQRWDNQEDVEWGRLSEGDRGLRSFRKMASCNIGDWPVSSPSMPFQTRMQQR